MSCIHHLALRTEDVARLADFYVHWFGLSVLREQRPHSIWLSLGEQAVLMVEKRVAAEPVIATGSQELLAFRVDEVRREQLAVQLSALGMLEARTEHTLYFRDPDGRRVGVSSYPL